MSATQNSNPVQDRRNQVMVGEFPTGFQTIDSSPQQQQAYADERDARVLQTQQIHLPIQANVKGRLNLSIVQAKLVKNYGLTRMDPYCRLRIGHAVFETPTAYNGGKNPQWDRDMQCFLQHWVDSLYVEIFIEKSFTADARVAWAHIAIPPEVQQGETVNGWFLLNGKQGDEKEGTINLVLTFTPVQDLPQMMPAFQPVMYHFQPEQYLPQMMPAFQPVVYQETVIQAPGMISVSSTSNGYIDHSTMYY